MCILSTGCQWRYVPRDLPPRSTLHDYLQRWQHDGTLQKIHHTLYVKCREQIGREATLVWHSIGFADGTLASLARRPA